VTLFTKRLQIPSLDFTYLGLDLFAGDIHVTYTHSSYPDRYESIASSITARGPNVEPGCNILNSQQNSISESIDDYIEHRIETDKVLEGTPMK
jgi:hypothetical protein